MRSPQTEGWLVTAAAVPAVAIAAAAAHLILSEITQDDGQWFARSMLFLPIYAGAAALLAGWLVGLTRPRLQFAPLAIGDARSNVIGLGILAAALGLAVQPSIFVAIAASTAGAAWIMQRQREEARAEIRG